MGDLLGRFRLEGDADGGGGFLSPPPPLAAFGIFLGRIVVGVFLGPPTAAVAAAGLLLDVVVRLFARSEFDEA
jgi:hypothetical protein